MNKMNDKDVDSQGLTFLSFSESFCGKLRLSKKHGDATPNTIIVLAAHQQMKAIIIASIKGGIYNREKGETLRVDILIIIIKTKKKSLENSRIIIIIIIIITCDPKVICMNNTNLAKRSYLFF
jgi:hypothetical protein